MFKRNNTSEGISSPVLKTITKTLSIKGQSCTFVIEDAMVKMIDGVETILDEELIDSMVMEMANAIKRNYSKYNPLPTQITLVKERSEKPSQEMKNDESDLIECIEPRFTLSDVYIPDKTEKQLDAVLSIAKHHKILFEEWGLMNTLKKGKGIALNFYGPPGTGKSMLAEAIAHELGKKVYVVNYANLESKYVGETPKNIQKAFLKAAQEDAVLVFDESDSFLGKRLTNVNQSADYGVNITRSVMLVELEKYEGIVIFTTNLMSNYDDAFRRRIIANLEFSYPDEKGRERIWATHLPDQLPLEEDIMIPLLAKKYDQLSGADIKDIVLNAAVFTLQNGRKKVSWEELDEAVHFIKQRYADNGILVKKETISQEQYERELAEIKGGM